VSRRFAGTTRLVRFILRRDRVRDTVWIVGIALVVVIQAGSVKGLYPTQADLDQAARSMGGNAAFAAFQGPPRQIDTLGGQVAWQVAIYGGIALGLMSLFMVTRHTRADEESGRLELLRASVVGRDAPTVAVLGVMVAANLVVGLAVTVLLPATVDLPVSGSLALGAGMAGCGIVFGSIAAVTAQVSRSTHLASGLAGVAMGVAFLLRAAGDAGGGILTWLSPIGWVSMVQPYTGERWWVLALFLVTSVVLITVAFALTSHRDLGSGLLADRPGPARAHPALVRPAGLAWRLGRVVLVAWVAGLLVGGISYGSIGNDVKDVIGDSQATKDIIAPGTGDIVDLFWVTTALMLSLIATGYALMATLRLRSEETAGRVEPLLATALDRRRWMGEHLLIAFGGSAVVLAAAGAGAGLAYGLAIGDAGQIPRLAAVVLTYTPAVWVMVGLAAALFGLAPRAMVVVWGALAVFGFVGLFAQLLDLPQWLIDLSPFQHVPQVPATSFDIVPVLVLALVAVGLTAVGLAGFRRRDLTT